MKRFAPQILTALLLPAVLLPAALVASPPGQAAQPAAPAGQHAMVTGSEVKWGDAPPALERGAQAAVLAGDPGQAGGLFVLRLKLPPGFSIARHTHPSDEHVTVIEGDLRLDMGDPAQAHSATFKQGDYVLLPAHMPHRASTTGGAIVQVHAMGPFELDYVDPKDDPRKRAAAK